MLIAEHGLNADGQVLATWGELGYVITDVSGPLPETLVASLESLLRPFA